MIKYTIGVRLRGYPKDYLKALSCEVSKKFNLDTFLDRRIVPHITLVRPFTTNNESELISSFKRILSEYDKPIFYNLNGFGTFDNSEKVIYAKVDKNSEIEDIIHNLESSLEEKIQYCEGKIKLPSEKNSLNLHCSIVEKGINKYFEEVKEFITRQKFPQSVQPLFRVYLLRDKFILREFDFYLRQNLDRFDAINPFVFKNTLVEFRKKTQMDFSDGVLLSLRKNSKQGL